MPDVSIITAARVDRSEGVGWLEECILSVALCLLDVEHIVVDDGSTQSLDMLKSRYPGVRWLRLEESGGPGRARNMGVRAASADWIFPLDADDVLLKDGLERLYLERCEWAYVYGPLLRFSGTQMPMPMKADWAYSEDRLRRLEGPIGVTALFHRGAWAAVNGWTPSLKLLEDIELWIKFAEIGICGRLVNTPTVAWRYSEHSRTSAYFADSAVAREARDEIRGRHRMFMEGKSMPCRKCPKDDEQKLAASSMGVTPEVPEGYALVKYVGGRQGSFYQGVPHAQRRYRVMGKGSWVQVMQSDVEYLLALRAGNAPEYVQRIQEPVIEPSEPAMQPIVELPDLEPVPFIADLPVREAVVLINEEDDLTTLRVWKAQELARETPRRTILQAIDNRVAK